MDGTDASIPTPPTPLQPPTPPPLSAAASTTERTNAEPLGSPDRPPAAPPDQPARDRIRTALERSMLVEAGAGTGKTTSMVGRMLALLREGCCTIDQLAAVTFTRKAAAELRERFQIALEQSANDTDLLIRDRMAHALANLEQCFVGTIHSFCGRLLRERPVEAGVDLAFSELDELADLRLRKQAWDEYAARVLAAQPELLERLAGLGLPLSACEPAYRKLADYPDVDEWPTPTAEEMTLPPLEPIVDRLQAYARRVGRLAARFPKHPGNDKLMPTLVRIARTADQLDLSVPGNLATFLEEFSAKTVVGHRWPGGKVQADEELAAFQEIREQVTEPLRRLLCHRRYALILEIVRPALALYDQLRSELGALSYSDLLLRAAQLLRGQPEIRRYFRRRWTHLLVDEFQDTDPVQAEIMLLLTADDPAETNWHRCRPVAGSLFVVGDPKQSIYRFRRADIVTYQQVKAIIQATGGEVVALTANFRTVAPLVQWINETFADAFPLEATAYSPEYRSMKVGRTDRPLPGSGQVDPREELPDFGIAPPTVRPTHTAPLLRLPIPGSQLRRKDATVAFDAEVVARTIHRLIAEQAPLPRTDKERAAGRPPHCDAGDFLILTRNKAMMSRYARWLQELGIPHEVTGSTVLNEIDELALLHQTLAALVAPEDPSWLVVLLRGGVFGVSDRVLYAFRRGGGVFDYRQPPTLTPAAALEPGAVDAGPGTPEAPSYGAAAQQLAPIFARLRRYADWLRLLPLAAAVERIVGDLGLMARAALAPGGAIQAGSVAKGIELLRAVAAEASGTSQLVEALGRIVSGLEPHDGLSAQPPDARRVRIMNLHKAKGLEAPVVFLAQPTHLAEFPADLHISRADGRTRGYLAVTVSKGFARRVVAFPPGWDDYAAEEERFARQERLRLNYVAATRAGCQLIISQAPGKASRSWSFFDGPLSGAPALPDPGRRPPLTRESTVVAADESRRALAAQARRWETCQRASYVELGLAGLAAQAGYRTNDGSRLLLLTPTEQAELLTALGRLRRQPSLALADLFPPPAIEDPSLTPGDSSNPQRWAAAVIQSAVWQRAGRSKQVLLQIPMALPVPWNNPAAAPVPTFLFGSIDLAFWEPTGWVLVNLAAAVSPPLWTDLALAAALGPYALLLRDAWHQVVRQPVAETGLLLLDAGRYVRF